MTKLYTTTQAAKALGVCPQRIKTKIKDGHFPHAKKCTCGNVWVIPEADIELNLKRKATRGSTSVK